MRFRPSAAAVAISLAIASLVAGCGGSSSNKDNTPAPAETARAFNRDASFFVCNQLGSSCESDDETAAEIVAASSDGMTLIYSNSPANSVGFVDITDPAAPAGLGGVALPGEPTSVAVLGGRALVAVNTSADFVNVAGQLVVVKIEDERPEAQLSFEEALPKLTESWRAERRRQLNASVTAELHARILADAAAAPAPDTSH